MSYDISIWSLDNPVSVKVELEAIGFKWGPDGAHYVSSKWLINLHTCSVLDEDIPTEIYSQLKGIFYLTELSLEPISASDVAQKLLRRASRILANATRGLIEDRQTGEIILSASAKARRQIKPVVNVVTPAPKKNWLSRVLEHLAPTNSIPQTAPNRIDLVELSWWFDHSLFKDRDYVVALFKTIQRHLPEAMPRRYGLYEPPQFKYSETGLDHFIDFLRTDSYVVVYPTHPVLSLDIHLDTGFVSRGNTRRFRTGHIALSIDASLLDDPVWANHLPKAWEALSHAISPFYGEARILRNYISGRATYSLDGKSESHPVTGSWWRGVPVAPAMAAVIGQPYIEIWPAFRTNGKPVGNLLFASSEKWTRSDDITTLVGPLPAELIQSEGKRLTPASSDPFAFSDKYARVFPFQDTSL
jgi:hypothetical protein